MNPKTKMYSVALMLLIEANNKEDAIDSFKYAVTLGEYDKKLVKMRVGEHWNMELKEAK